MLIDCGVHSSVSDGSKKVDEIVDDIASVTTHLDVVVATHEHWDHISGFMSAADKFAEHGFTVGEIWMGWTENPKDAQARAFDTYKGVAMAALQGAAQRLNAVQGLSPHLDTIRSGLAPLMGFAFGAKGERVRGARDALVAMAPQNVRYLEPKMPPLTLPEVSGLRIYVLGPPRDPKLFGTLERASEMYGVGCDPSLAMASTLNAAFSMGEDSTQSEDWALPFEPTVGADLSQALALAQADAPASATSGSDSDEGAAAFLSKHYLNATSESAANKKLAPDISWRRIDHDWLGVSADLAIQLDARTNNSSLVLAFEFVETGRVLLFTADAQVGNWLSWQDVAWKVGQQTVTGPDLLARTVFLKVGHHGSHNATLKQNGLELMDSPDLSAFIPTNEKDATKVGWGEMPFEEICTALDRRASGRVIRADGEWNNGQGDGLPAPSGSIVAVRHKANLYVELELA
jgi:hypothetical protein